VDPVYDENGNEIEPGYPNTTTEYNWVGSSYYSDWQWAVVDSQPTMVSETIPPHEELQYVEEYSTPTIRHTANRTNTAWLWRNPSAVQTGAYRDLMKLTPAGLSFPAPYVTGWARRTLLNDKSFTLSETNEVENDDERQSFGTEITLDGIEVWGEQNGALTDIDRISNPTERRSAKLEESKLTLSTTTLDPVSGSGITMTTQVQAGYANFGGIVEVQGVLRVRPAGDLSMGQFTNGTAP
ncbi:MAG: hypothetical protein KDK99_19925, partial [Verrucomicrobiales bacterium]|nr:hypothetical protein [Verrucomicrobiales bacterium]